MGERGALKSPRDAGEPAFASITSPLRSAHGQMPSQDARAPHLQRRFTTNNIPTVNTPLSPIGQQRRQAAEPTEFTTAVSSNFPHCRTGAPTLCARPSQKTLARIMVLICAL
jgi:hypothetical protein